ncbi:MAG: polysaccharide deacetylase family protein [Verrucomicrobia bacterium]|nr:polysaccharide deacetylase family protein [Verrucomicrobiota bacterium]
MNQLISSLRKAIRPYSPRPTLHKWIFRREIPLDLQFPIASFTFDDFPGSALHNGGRLLREFDARGTYYASLGLMNTEIPTQGPCFTREDLDTLIADGHELGCHTYAHVGARQKGLVIFEEEIRRNRLRMEEILPGHALKNFAYPGGELTLRLKHRMHNHALSSRGTYNGINRRRVDLDLLLCQNMRDNIPLEWIKRTVVDACDNPGWLIFYTHDVRDSPGPGGCSPQYMQAVLRIVAEKCRILTVGDALELIRPKNPI